MKQPWGKGGDWAIAQTPQNDEFFSFSVMPRLSLFLSPHPPLSSFTPSFRYFVSFVVEINPLKLTPKNQSVGIDLGLKTFFALSDGMQFQSPNYLKADHKISKFQRQLARRSASKTPRNGVIKCELK
jgi:transposase